MALDQDREEAILLELVDSLRTQGSWAGETHVQKGAYLLLGEVPMGIDFILYKYGPFSFELRDKLSEMRAQGFLELEISGGDYGPRFKVSPLGQQLKSRFPKTLGIYQDAIQGVATLVRDRNVADLERLATAVMVLRDNPDQDDDWASRRLRELKPHVSPPMAREAVETARKWMASLPG